jgi:hypothetical protein
MVIDLLSIKKVLQDSVPDHKPRALIDGAGRGFSAAREVPWWAAPMTTT